MKELESKLRKLKAFAPYRIIWGYIEDGKAHAFASYDKRQMNKAKREGKEVYTISSN